MLPRILTKGGYTLVNYTLHEKPRNWRDGVGYTLQFVFAVLTATILISTICGTSIAAGLVAAGIGTICFLLITGFKAPIVISNSGATVSAVVGAIALSNAVETNFAGVIIGGAVIAIIYSLAALAIKQWGTGWLYRLITPVIAGTTIIVIGANLATFIPTYALVAGGYSLCGILVAFITAAVVILCAHYGKGLVRTLPFLIGLIVGYILSFILTVTGVAPLVDTSQFVWKGILSIPDFAFLHANFATFDWSTLPQIILSFGMVSLAALTEHIGDMTTASAVTGYDLIRVPGLHRTLVGDGVGSLLGTIIGAQPNTTYSEYTSTMSVSGVYSSWFTLYTAIVLIALGFIAPFNQFLMALPNAVFAGVSIVAYGMIAAAGLRTLIDGDIFKKTKNQFIFAAMLTTGVSGLAITAGAFNLTGIALAMITGVILNLILKDPK